MRQKRDLHYLKTWVELARQIGIFVPGGSNGGGYIDAAKAIGLTPHNKADAKLMMAAWASKVLAERFIQAPAQKTFSGQQRQVAQRVETKTRRDLNIDPASPEFLQTFAWRQLRMQVIKRYGRRCMCCGATPDTGAVIHVDHIKPRKLFPQLALDFDNLQVLCGDCNHGKGNWDRTDWRPADAILPADQQQHINAILAE